MSKKLFTKVVSLSLTAAMVLSMAPINAGAAKKTAKPKSMKAPKSSKIKVGQTKTIKVSRNSKKSTKDVKYVNFKPKSVKNIGIGVKTSDDAVVSVEKESNGKYTYTGVNKGTATLTITSRAKTSKGKKLKAKMEVTVINPFKVTQTGAYTFTMSTADKLDKIDKKDIKVMEEGSSVDNAVKEVKIAEDKMSVEVKMAIPFVDQKKYEVTFGKEKDSFVASVGAPKAINIKTQSVVVNKPTAIEYAVVDEKGMDVTEVIDAKNKVTVEVSTKAGFYDTAAKKLTLWKVGDTAEVTVVYHTWTYDQKTGKENVIEAKATVSCVDKSAVTIVGLDKWTVADRVLSWDTDEMKHTIAQGGNSKIWVRMKKSDGTYVDNKKNKAEFSFDQLNTATLYVYADGSVYATREGVEYAKVTYFDGAVKYQYTLPITVGAKAKATTLILSQPYVVISKTAGVGTPMTAKVLDQYGDDMELVGKDFKAEKISGENVANITKKNAGVTIVAADLNATETILKLAVNSLSKEGTGVYKLTVAGLNATVTVSSQDVSSAASGYVLKADVNEFDASINDGTKNAVLAELAKGVELHFYETKAGLVDKKADTAFADAKIKVNGKELELTAKTLVKANGTDGYVFQPVVDDTNGNYVVLAKAGGYNIEVEKEISGKTVVVSTYINVKNTTTAPKDGETYKIGSISGSATATVKAMVDEAVENKVIPFKKLADSAAYAVVLHKGGKVSGAVDTTAADDTFYLDTAALPAFKTESGKLIWGVEAGLNKKLEVIKAANVSAVELKATTESAKFVETTGGVDGDKKGHKETFEITITGTNLNNAKELINAENWKWNSGAGAAANYKITNITKGTVENDNKNVDLTFEVTYDADAGVADADEAKLEYDGADKTGTPTTTAKVWEAEGFAISAVDGDKVMVKTAVNPAEPKKATGEFKITGKGLNRDSAIAALKDKSKYATDQNQHDKFAIDSVEFVSSTYKEAKVKVTFADKGTGGYAVAGNKTNLKVSFAGADQSKVDAVEAED